MKKRSIHKFNIVLGVSFGLSFLSLPSYADAIALESTEEYIASNFYWIVGITVAVVIIITTLLVLLFQRYRQFKIYDKMAHIDSMTGLPNRRSYEEDFNKLSKEKLPLNFIMGCMDVDGLKRVNDTLGHAAGDEVICAAAEILEKLITPYGKLYRCGGDEFVALFHADHNQLAKLKYDIKDMTLKWKGKLVEKISFSCGFAENSEVAGATLPELHRLADERMYKEKISDRDAYKVKTKSGSIKNVIGYGQLFRNREDGELLEAFLAAYESQYDTLTGLPAMSYFLENANAIDNAVFNSGHNAVVLCFNFNNMKGFNKRFGLKAGDSLLIYFANILAEKFGKNECSRFGEDRYYALTTEVDLEKKLDEIFRILEKYNGGASLTLRVGVYVYDMENRINLSMACDRARIASDYEKKRFESHFTYFSKKMEENLMLKDFITTGIDNAIANEHIKVFYQPKVNAKTGEVTGFEALARWIDPDRGFLSPGDFIPVLEEYSLTYKLDYYIVERVAKQIIEARKEHLTVYPVSFNISRTDFLVANVYNNLIEIVDKYGLNRNLFKVEITESSIMSNPLGIKKEIEKFREAGFEVLMDDFGSGYSSLSTLRDFDFDEIKIDIGFMRNFDQKAKHIVRAIIEMAHRLKIHTLAEGVETEEHLRFLNEVGCETIQGYYFGKPEPFDVIIEKWLKKEDEVND